MKVEDITDEMFDNKLLEIIEEIPMISILRIAGVYELVREEYYNDVLDALTLDAEDIWVEILTEDSCMWQLKGKTWTESPTLEDMQESVGGNIQYMPNSYSLSGIKNMIVNEEGIWKKLPHNQLATQQLNLFSNPVLGNVIVQVDAEFVTKDYWLKEAEE
tara:strand:+ start:18703 stop:19182 length:480 start_codon:yes stop_codon:yes gene_type:complete